VGSASAMKERHEEVLILSRPFAAKYCRWYSSSERTKKASAKCTARCWNLDCSKLGSAALPIAVAALSRYKSTTVVMKQYVRDAGTPGGPKWVAKEITRLAYGAMIHIIAVERASRVM
jgi:hypothetical protein